MGFVTNCQVGLWVDYWLGPRLWLEVLIRAVVNCSALAVYQDQAFVVLCLIILEDQSQENFWVPIDVEVTHSQSSLEGKFLTSMHLGIERVRYVYYLILEKPRQILNSYLIGSTLFYFFLSKVELREHLLVDDLLGSPAQVLLVT